MRQRYLRVPAQRKDTVAAFMVSGVLAAGVGAVTFYVTRLLLAREPLLHETEDAAGPQVALPAVDSRSSGGA